MVIDLNGRRALVTGASGAIGHAIATALHDAGAGVALSGTRVERLEGLAATLGARAHVVPANLADRAAAAGLAGEAAAALGGTIDILVNNAGFARDALALRMRDEDWQSVLDVDLTAAFVVSRGVLRGMVRARRGRIVNIGSVVGATGNAGQANYVAAKAGLVGMGKALAQEVAQRGVTVNTVAPGAIQTAMTETLDDARRAAILARIPAGRFGAPEEVASAVLFLASDEAGYITGQTLHVNGGMAML